MVWGTVITVDPAHKLQTVGNLFIEFGGPGHIYNTFTLEKQESATVLRLGMSVLAPDAAQVIASMRSGWDILFDCMKARVEGNPQPEQAVG